MSEQYQVVFQGQIHEDAKLNEVKVRIAKMFKADEVTVARLFSGKRFIIKANLSAEAADKYSIAFAKAGAICELELMEGVAGDSAGDSGSDGSAGTDTGTGERNIGKIAAIAAAAVLGIAVLAGAGLYFTGFFG